MKKIGLVYTVLLSLILSSCGITQKFEVYGKPDTEIYTPNMKKVSTIQNNGVGKVTLHKKEYGAVYVAYLLAREPNSSLYVPFALDYKNAKVAYPKWLGYGVGIPAAIAVAGGCLLGSGNGSFGAVTMGVGSALTIMSLGTWVGMDLTAGPTERFRYLKQQNTIQDIMFVKPTFDTAPKSFRELARANDASVSEPPSIVGSKSKKSFGDKSSRKIGSSPKQVTGNYTAAGSLSNKGNVVEEYSAVTIRIKSHGKNSVVVEVLDDNNEQFFDEGIVYKVTKDRKGGYILKHEKNNGSIISIDKYGNIQFIHPRVNIDGEFYWLKVSGRRNK